MRSDNCFYGEISPENSALIYGGSELSNWVCKMLGRLYMDLQSVMGLMSADVSFNDLLNKILDH